MRTLSMVVLLVFAGCGGPPKAATCAATCNGCCDSAGACQVGTAPAACGTGGRVCSACSTSDTCSLGFCVPKPGGSGGGSAGGGAMSAGGSAGGAVVVVDAGSSSPVDAGAFFSPRCVGGYLECGVRCVDPRTDESNCGACGVQCQAGLVCNAGQCRALPQDCLAERCPDDFGCNPETRTCSRSCFSNADCTVPGTQCRQGTCSCAATHFDAPACGTCFGGKTPACFCAEGFEPSASGCRDIDECARSSACGVPGAGSCTNFSGGFDCACNRGFVQDGATGRCVADPCATNNGGCDSNASCDSSSPMEYRCSCRSGFSGDGRTCRALCSPSSPFCPQGLTCFPDVTSQTGMSCARPGFGQLGEFCSANTDCAAGSFCATNEGSNVSVCTRLCSSTSQCGVGERCSFTSGYGQCAGTTGSTCDLLSQNCEPGLACHPLLLSADGGTGLEFRCIPAGFAAPEASCTGNTRCPAGYVCASRMAGSTDYRCRRICDLSAPICHGQTCSPLGGAPVGLCL